jgi:hypothetical protein
MNPSIDSTLGTFITMMDQFITEMISTFPNEAKLRVYANSFNLVKKTNPRKILKVFMESLGPYSQQIINKDESLMLDENVLLSSDLNMKAIWNSPGITDTTKDAIWAHLNTLLMFGTTINNIPSGLMNSIEKLASEYASQMGDSPDMDPAMLMANLQSMMKNMK